MGFKRLVCCFFALALLLSACTYNTNNNDNKTAEPTGVTHAVYRINISAECISNDSVGDEWVHSYFLDGQKIDSGHLLTLPLGEPPVTKTITATIEEVDKYPDISTKDITFE